jgi:hypothetical protein
MVECEHFGYNDNTFTSMLSIACHILNEHHYFSHLYKYLITTLCIHQYYVLKLSPASMQCTHGVAIKLFYRYIIDCVEH